MPRVRRKSVVEKRNRRKIRMGEARQKAKTDTVNIKPEDGDRSDLDILIVSDEGSVNPAFPSHDGIPPSGSSVSNSCAHSTPHSHTHSLNHTTPHSYTHSHTHNLTHCHTHSITHSDTHSRPHCDTHSAPHSDTHSTSHCDSDSLSHSDTHPYNNSDRTLIAHKKFSVEQFIESSGIDCLKTQTDFDEAFAEAFPSIGVKGHSCYNKQLPKNKVANKELIEDNATLFWVSHFEIMDSDIPVAT